MERNLFQAILVYVKGPEPYSKLHDCIQQYHIKWIQNNTCHMHIHSILMGFFVSMDEMYLKILIREK